MKAVVQGGRVVVQDRVDYPEGTELELGVFEPGDGFVENDDELNDAERAERDAAIADAWRSYQAGERMYSSEEVWEALRAARK